MQSAFSWQIFPCFQPFKIKRLETMWWIVRRNHFDIITIDWVNRTCKYRTSAFSMENNKCWCMFGVQNQSKSAHIVLVWTPFLPLSRSTCCFHKAPQPQHFVLFVVFVVAVMRWKCFTRAVFVLCFYIFLFLLPIRCLRFDLFPFILSVYFCVSLVRSNTLVCPYSQYARYELAWSLGAIFTIFSGRRECASGRGKGRMKQNKTNK